MDNQENEIEELTIDDFLNVDYGIIGRTVSTISEPNTSSTFHFWVADTDASNIEIEIGNIIAAKADTEDDITFGVVSEMRAYSDVESFIADYLSHDFGNADLQIPTEISEVVVVTCEVMRNLSSKTKPVGRSKTYYPSEMGIQFAYGIINQRGESVFSGNAIPIGIFENGDGTISEISIDEDFLLGPEGAHLNVSGISGLATKTSAIQFVLKSLETHTSKQVAYVLFNVKSRDLLYVDQLNPRLQSPETELENWSEDVYSRLSIPINAFSDAEFFAPADPSGPNENQSLRELPTNRFEWNLPAIQDDIPSLFNPMDWDDKMEGVWFVIREKIDEVPLNSYSGMYRWVQREIDTASQQNRSWVRGNHIATWRKMLSHLGRFPNSYPGLIATGGQGNEIPWGDLGSGDMYVVDIQMLNDSGKKLVFSRAVRTISELLENEELDLDSVVIFVDELNKFAPSGNVRSPLKSRLIDITARGRSLGLVLFGAEQFASSVEKEIVENSSTFLFGRTESNELRSPNYTSFSNELKTKLTMLPQGQLLSKFAKFPQPIFIKFPYPTCMPGDQYQSLDDS